MARLFLRAASLLSLRPANAVPSKWSPGDSIRRLRRLCLNAPNRNDTLVLKCVFSSSQISCQTDTGHLKRTGLAFDAPTSGKEIAPSSLFVVRHTSQALQARSGQAPYALPLPSGDGLLGGQRPRTPQPHPESLLRLPCYVAGRGFAQVSCPPRARRASSSPLQTRSMSICTFGPDLTVLGGDCAA